MFKIYLLSSNFNWFRELKRKKTSRTSLLPGLEAALSRIINYTLYKTYPYTRTYHTPWILMGKHSSHNSSVGQGVIKKGNSYGKLLKCVFLLLATFQSKAQSHLTWCVHLYEAPVYRFVFRKHPFGFGSNHNYSVVLS